MSKFPVSVQCSTCAGTGFEKSGVCHCGEYMDGYHDNHSPVEMARKCEDCGGAGWKTVEEK